MDKKGHEIVEGGKGPLSKEDKPQKGAKQARVTQTLVDRRGDSHVGTLAWIAALVLDGAPLPADASIRNFQQGKVGYIADAVEQSLLLPKDMADLRSIRKHKVFLSLKKDLALVGFLTSLSLFLFFFFIL